MAPANNLERQAARRIAAAGSIKYTEAIRRLRASGVQPSQILDGTVDAASIRNAPTETGTVSVDEAHHLHPLTESRIDALSRLGRSPSAASRDAMKALLLPQHTSDLGDIAALAPRVEGSEDDRIRIFLKDPSPSMAAAEELLKIVLDTQGEPPISLLGLTGAGKSVLLANVAEAARAVPDVQVFTASGLRLSTIAGLPEFLREAQSAQQTALVLLDEASGIVGNRATDPDIELGRAAAEQIILRGHPAAAVVAASQRPLTGDADDSGRVFMGWQHMRLPVAVGPEITALGEREEARHVPLYVPATGEARLLGHALAALTRMPSPQDPEAAAVPVPAKPVNPLAKEECPTNFTWSAFGADHPDTQCENGLLVDMDSRTISDIPCPFDNPEGFTEYQFGYLTIPKCTRCTKALPVGTEIHYHEGDDGSLWCSAACPDCGLQRANVTYILNLSDDEDFAAMLNARAQEARAGHVLARAAKIDYAEALHRMRITKVTPAQLLAVEAGTSKDLAAQTLMAGGVPELYPFDPSQLDMTSMRFQNPPGHTLITTAEGHGYKVTAEPVEPPSFTLGTDAASAEPVRAVLAGQVWEHTAVCGDADATTAELLRLAAELTDQGVAVTVFSGNPEQTWPWQARVVHTGPGHWVAAQSAARQIEAERAALLAGPVGAGTEAPVPVVVLVDSAAMAAHPGDAGEDEAVDMSAVLFLWVQWVRKGRFTGLTMVTAMEFGATRSLKDMAWVLVPDAGQVPWSGWPEQGRAVRDRRGMVRALREDRTPVFYDAEAPAADGQAPTPWMTVTGRPGIGYSLGRRAGEVPGER